MTSHRTVRWAILTTAMLVIAVIGQAGIPDLRPLQAQTLPEFSLDDINYSFPERSNQNGNNFRTITVNLSHASTVETSVDLYSQDTTATAGSDYVAFDDTLVFPPGTTTQDFQFQIVETERNGIHVVETTERFSVALRNPTAATLSNASEGRVTITDNDETSVWLSLPGHVIEGEAIPITYNVEHYIEFDFLQVIQAAHGPAAHPYVAHHAEPHQDYVHVNNIFRINPYERTKVVHSFQTLQDQEREGFEYLVITHLGHGLTDDVTIRDPHPVIVIDDDDIPPGVQIDSDWDKPASLHRKALFVAEDGNATYDLWLGRPPSATVTVSLDGAGDPHLTAYRSSVTFSPDDWIKPHVITVSASADADALNGVRTVTHSIETADPSLASTRAPRIYWSEADTTDDGGGSDIFTKDERNNGVTVDARYVPDRHHSSPYWFQLRFSEPIKGGYNGPLRKSPLGCGSTVGQVCGVVSTRLPIQRAMAAR